MKLCTFAAKDFEFDGSANLVEDAPGEKRVVSMEHTLKLKGPVMPEFHDDASEAMEYMHEASKAGKTMLFEIHIIKD